MPAAPSGPPFHVHAASGAFPPATRARLADGGALAVHVRAAVARETVDRWAAGVLAAPDAWTSDFDGEQFSLGRAFYTHLETDRAEAYFDGARASDALVERHAPGLQRTMRDLMAGVVGARVIAREGWCGAGVHVFPATSP
ncbi:MAG TPA: hypothetical protein VE987_12680, partial [Polyangiaceae bacterium]|nr:hypothetical protein [Polyangiaceae bacterium]